MRILKVKNFSSRPKAGYDDDDFEDKVESVGKEALIKAGIGAGIGLGTGVGAKYIANKIRDSRIKSVASKINKEKDALNKALRDAFKEEEAKKLSMKNIKKNGFFKQLKKSAKNLIDGKKLPSHVQKEIINEVKANERKRAARVEAAARAITGKYAKGTKGLGKKLALTGAGLGSLYGLYKAGKSDDE